MLTERLGAARGTTLYRAIRPDSAKEPAEVAMRVADRLDDASAVEAIRTEYDVLRALDDPRVPKVHGFYPGQAALALSWCGGVTLAEVLAAARDHAIELDAPTALDLGAEIAAALRVAHGTVVRGAPVVHGHLDPTRVQLDGEGRLSVVGFGLVRPDDRPGYTPPEQAAGHTATPASDQWTLGALLVEMLLGRRLYDGLPDANPAVLDGAVEPWVAPVEAMIPSLARTLRKMLSPAPEERLASDGEVVQALLSSARETGGVSGRSSVVAAVLQRRALLAHSFEPVAMPDARLTLNVLRPVLDRSETGDTESSEEQDEGLPEAETPDDPEDPFPDSPTSPDGYGRLSDLMFSDEITDPGGAEPIEDAELHGVMVTGQIEAPTTDPGLEKAPPPKPGAGLLATERLGLVLAVVLAALAVVFVVTRAL